MSIQLQKPDYIIVYVSDMQRSTVFYRDVLGLPLKFTSPGWTEFNTGSTTLALHMTGGDKVLQHQGRPPAGQAHKPSGVTLAVLHDPDGLGITLQQRYRDGL